MVRLAESLITSRNAETALAFRGLYEALAPYERPSTGKAVWQLGNSLVPYLALWGLMIFTVQSGLSYWITLGLALLASPFLVRLFIIFHDCGHGSFMASHKANRIVGFITGILTFTPFEDWQRAHAGHHATSGDLDRRGTGDIWTATVDEYRSMPWHTRVAYRLYRNPLVMFGVGPSAVMLLLQRFWHAGARRRERMSVILTNVALAFIVALAAATIGIKTYILIQLPIVMIGGAAGVWLFYVQHQFERTDWARHEQWNPIRAALQGSSHYKLPRWLQWCTGNIGLHHIHHVRPGIPNYRLQQCYDQVPAVREVEPLTVWKSLRSLRLHLWHEREQQLVTFGAVRSIP